MDPVRNPYTPGAGTKPSELAGRDGVITEVQTSIQRLKIGRSMQIPVLVGLRGVGKTVLLNRLHRLAIAAGVIAKLVEAPEGKSLPSLIIPQLRSVLLDMNATAKAKDKVAKAISAVRNFIGSVKFKYEDVEVSIFNAEPYEGLADSGNLDNDLSAVLVAVGEAAHANATAVVLFIDELQFVPEKELGALIAALHKCGQMELPVSIVGAGLPQLIGNVGKAKSYSERLFKFHHIDKLDAEAARVAVIMPARREGVEFTREAVDEILAQTHRYPYFLQEWGDKSWAVAVSSPIDLDVVNQATNVAITHLDASFFAVRYDRCSPSERAYMRAMAELGDESVRSGEVAASLDKNVQQVAPVRNSLIRKGMIYSPAHGDAAFTVPLFAQFMRRKIPPKPI
jgi:AAA ATPase domain